MLAAAAFDRAKEGGGGIYVEDTAAAHFQNMKTGAGWGEEDEGKKREWNRASPSAVKEESKRKPAGASAFRIDPSHPRRSVPKIERG